MIALAEQNVSDGVFSSCKVMEGGLPAWIQFMIVVKETEAGYRSQKTKEDIP